MEIFEAVTLGLVQGLTEFLPISSSGHLVIGQHLFGLTEAELVFDVCVHVGTLVAVLFYFRHDLFSMVKTLFQVLSRFSKKDISLSQAWELNDIKLIVLIITGTLPTMVIGLALREIAATLFSSLLIVGVSLIITGLVLWITRSIPPREPRFETFSIKKSLVIGFIQGLSITPGISRSGSTIATALLLGLDRELAARYSFLLSIPAITAAALLSILDLEPGQSLDTVPLLSGMAMACVSGYAALKLLVFIVKKGRLYAFAPYCWIVGACAIAMAFL